MVSSDTDIAYMQQALKLARKGLYTTAPNPNVGCVIVHNGTVLGSGYHHQAGLPHAEICAMQNAGQQDLTGATVYVTLEPCSHTGLTPPCAQALINAKVGRVVCAMIDPNPLVSGKGVAMLRNAGIQVDVGVCEAEARALNHAFIYAMEHDRPYITAKFGMSLDGKIALANRESKWITSAEARSDVQRMRAQIQAILTSATTVLTDDPQLNVRYNELPRDAVLACPRDMLHQPVKIVIDAKKQITGKERIFADNGVVWLLRLSKDEEVHEYPFGTNSLIIEIPADPKESTKINLDVMLAHLHYRKIRSVMVEAGGRLVKTLFARGLINELVTYIAPKILGEDGISAFTITGYTDLTKVPTLTLVDMKQFHHDVRLTYRFGE